MSRIELEEKIRQVMAARCCSYVHAARVLARRGAAARKARKERDRDRANAEARERERLERMGLS